MATSARYRWPSPRGFVSAYAQNLMAADSVAVRMSPASCMGPLEGVLARQIGPPCRQLHGTTRRQLDGTTCGSTVVGVGHGQLTAVRVSTRKAVCMAFREVPVFEVREVLRLWLDGRGLRSIAAVTPPDRKTVRRVVDVAVGLGLDRAGGAGQLDDGFVSLVMAELAVSRPDRHGESWAVIAGEHDRIAEWVKTNVPVVKMHELLARRGVVVPERTLHRYVAEQFGPSPADASTVPLADCEPGAELQVDWAKLGFIVDGDTGRRRTVWALVFTSVFSRHCFVWLSYSQALDAVIAGFDAAWAFFDGVFKVAIPDNMKTIVTNADDTNARLCEAFVEYAQWAGFFVDPAPGACPPGQGSGRTQRAVLVRLVLGGRDLRRSHRGPGRR